MLDNRELASLILLGGLLAFALTRPGVRSSMRRVLKMFFHPKILLPVLLYLGIETGLVWLAALIGLWDFHLLSATILWVAFSGVGLLFSVNEAGEDPQFFRKRTRQIVAGAAFYEFFLNIKSFSLPIELILVLVVSVVAMMQVLAISRAEFTNLRKPLNIFLSLIGLGLLAATLVDLIANWKAVDFEVLGQTLLLPVWLTLATLPYIYFLALFAGYELAFMRMERLNNRRKPSVRSRLAVVIELKGRVTDVHAFGGLRGRSTAQSNSFGEARKEVKGFISDRARKRADEQAQEDRLERYAGVDGVDESGKRLDQREFEETKKALRWLATCQMGWYRRDSKYRRDSLDVLGDFTSHGLPDPHCIVLRVRKDGKAWFAYRATVSGWVFAIGASAPPPDQRLYDGSQPPTGYPGKGLSWGQSALTTPPIGRAPWRSKAGWSLEVGIVNIQLHNVQ